jgi:3-oxoacyl-[acyl-carrier-protein] synthase II
MFMKRVAVTGIGMVTPLGLDTASSWDGFVSARSAVRRIESYDPTGEKVVVAAEVCKADAEKLASGLDPDVRDRTSRFVHFATAAAREALEHAGHPQRSAPERFGVICGVGFGEPLPSEGYRVGPTTIIKAMPNGAPAWIAILNGLKGPNYSCNSACASGAHAIGTAFDQVRFGRATGMLTGGVDTVITRDVMRTYAWMRALNTAKDEEPQRCHGPLTRRGGGLCWVKAQRS